MGVVQALFLLLVSPGCNARAPLGAAMPHNPFDKAPAKASVAT